ncbi:unnamed protein product [Hermetia illucens]|uniref:Uncharacterized protein n=1 Tax=Hermetia illucens TaxID=343691 RepID=A0A7R8Z0P3_HERIL|nr:unnamed protein product [Hermetia illucens]
MLPTINLTFQLFVPHVGHSVSHASINTALNITSIPSGIYMEHLGYAYTNRGVLRISLTIPWNDVKNDSITATSVAEKINKLYHLGRVATSKIQCADLSQQLQELNQKVQQKIHTLLFMHPRKKRGVLDDSKQHYLALMTEYIITSTI